MTTLIVAPVSSLNSGARRCSGSAICGPVKVITVASTPSCLSCACAPAGRERDAARKRQGERAARTQSGRSLLSSFLPPIVRRALDRMGERA